MYWSCVQAGNTSTNRMASCPRSHVGPRVLPSLRICSSASDRLLQDILNSAWSCVVQTRTIIVLGEHMIKNVRIASKGHQSYEPGKFIITLRGFVLSSSFSLSRLSSDRVLSSLYGLSAALRSIIPTLKMYGVISIRIRSLCKYFSRSVLNHCGYCGLGFMWFLQRGNQALCLRPTLRRHRY